MLKAINQIPEKTEKPFVPGDAVRMTDTMASGEIIKIESRMAQIETGSMRLFVPLDKIERISKAELRKSIRSESIMPERDPDYYQAKTRFQTRNRYQGCKGRRGNKPGARFS